MNREIKFRAWDLISKKMYREVQIITPHENTILMQYTGLKDKNGKEIYEGDICKTPEGNYKCVWIDGSATFAFQEAEDEYGDFYDAAIHTSIQDFEVIGNVYENKELLK